VGTKISAILVFLGQFWTNPLEVLPLSINNEMQCKSKGNVPGRCRYSDTGSPLWVKTHREFVPHFLTQTFSELLLRADKRPAVAGWAIDPAIE
jgi:hypothetical protein